MMTRYWLKASVVVAGIAVTAACGKKEEKGSGATTGAPQAYPPTALVTPSVLVTSAGTGAVNLFANISALDTNAEMTPRLGAFAATEPSDANTKATLMTTLKERLFSAGPTNMLQLVKNVDRRISEYDQRVSGMEKVPSCLSSTPVDVSSTFSVPAAAGATTTFPLFGQCQETMSPGLTIMIGKKDNDWYLVDGATKDLDGTDSCVMSMSKISGSTDLDRIVDGYMVVVYKGMTNNFSGSTALMHFKANVVAGTLELTAGGVNIGAEQIHAKSSKTHVYLQAQIGSNTAAGTLYESCFSATDLSNVAMSNCSSLKSSLELTSLGTKAVGQTSQSSNVQSSEANNVDLTTLVPNYCGKLATAFSAIPKFSD